MSFVAIILALVSARLSARYQSLALKAAAFAMVAWVVGMTLAVITENPLVWTVRRVRRDRYEHIG